MQIIEELQSGFSTAANGTANVYARGTSTPVIYYTDFEGLSPVVAGTAIVLDSQGAAQVYVNQLITLIVLDSSGTTVSDSQPGDAAPLTEVRSLSFNGNDYESAAEAPGNPTTLQSVLDKVLPSFGTTDWKVLVNGEPTTIKDAISSFTDVLFNVKSDLYGAKGDGATDDTSAIAAAITAAQVSGGVVFFPVGTYRVTASLTWPNKVHFLGTGPESSIISMDNVSTTDLIDITGSPHSPQNFLTMRNLRLTAMQIQAGNLIDLLATNVLVQNCYLGGDKVQGTMVDGGTGLSVFEDCTFAPGTGIVMWTATATSLGATFSRCLFLSQSTTRLFTVVEAKGVLSMDDCTFDGSAVTSGTYTMLDLSTAAVSSAHLTACTFMGASAATDTGISTPDMGGAGGLNETGSTFTDVSVPILFNKDISGFPTLTSKSAFSSREGYAEVATTASASATANADEYGNYLVEVTNAGPFTLNADLSALGSRLTVTIFNSNGATLQVSFGTAFTGDEPGVGGGNTISNGARRSWEFVCMPFSTSALRWHCIGSSFE